MGLGPGPASAPQSNSGGQWASSRSRASPPHQQPWHSSRRSPVYPSPSLIPRACSLHVLPCLSFPLGQALLCKMLSHVRLLVTPWTTQSMAFSMQECWSGWLFPSPRDLPDPGIEPRSPALWVDSLPAGPTGESCYRSHS